MGAPLDQPYRGSGIDRPTGLALPPDPMPLVRAGILLKRWHYRTFWSPALSLCAAQVHVGPIAQEYWGVWDRRDKRFRQRTNELPFEPSDEFEIYRPEGQAYIWSRKQFCVRATATVRLEATTRRTDGAVFVDMNAGYHTRHTRWRWSAGAGSDQHGRTVAWNAIVGLFDTPQQSERTVWIDGVPSEIGPVRFSNDLRSVSFSAGGEIRFQQEANIRKRVGLFLVKSRYDHAFAPWEGSLPGGIQLKDAVGVRERQDALW